jgi:hypothetical protein
MLLARYALYVGGVLLALLLVVNALLPALPVQSTNAPDSDLPRIRILSERRLPDRVVYDTSIPTITPPPAAIADTNSTPAPAVADISAKARGALAQLQPSDAGERRAPDPRESAPQSQHKRKTAARTAKRRAPRHSRMVARQSQFGWFGPDIW